MLLRLNRALEIDLSTLTVQADYEEARIAIPYYLRPTNIQKKKFRMINLEMQCSLPDPAVQIIDWERLNIDDRVERATARVHLPQNKESEGAPEFGKAFDFYGGYTRISEN